MLEAGFYNLDCMEGMAQFPDGFFDLAIVDPPYGISADTLRYYERVGAIPAVRRTAGGVGLHSPFPACCG